MKKTIVIVGGVAGGASAAARLRRLSEDTEIILLEKGEYISFANCGLPYYIGGSIAERDALLVQTVEGMSQRFNIDIRNFNEAISINKEEKTIKVRDIQKHEEYDLSYDYLLLSPGAAPIQPPIPGLEESSDIFRLRNIPDTDKIKNFVDVRKPEKAVVIGGGFIGIEMVENLVDRGIAVTLIEAADQVMAPFDPEMAAYLHNHLREKGVELILGDGVARFEENGKVVATNSGKRVNTDMIILSIGVRPDAAIAKDAGLDMNERGFIKVDKEMRTSDPSIFAVGDAIESFDYIYKEPMTLALASPANRQARIAANVMMGIEDEFKGFMGTSVAKIFDYTAASTGWNEKKLKAAGKKYHTVLLHPMNHAGYYPGAQPIHLKVLFEIPSGKVLGGQALGIGEGVEKRIDVLATAITAGMTMDDLTDLELAYAPPYSSAKDPVNMAGYMGQNVQDGRSPDLDIFELDEKLKDNGLLIDVRNEEEILMGEFPEYLNIPLDQLRDSLDKIPKDKDLYVTCQVGLRGYLAQQVLKENGIDSVNVKGGYTSYRELKEQENPTPPTPPTAKNAPIFCTDNPDVLKEKPSKGPDRSIDARGLQCPGPIAQVYKALNEMKDGELLEVKATDTGFKRDIGAWCGKTHNRLISLTEGDGYTTAYIAKGEGESSALEQMKEGATMVVFSGDFDKTMAALIIATGAAAMGKKVTMFFTFWGLNILRKEGVKVEKEGMEKMFSKMMPEGVSNLKLSKMNMMGMGTNMMKKVMEEKNVDSPEELLYQAMDMGVNLVACAMSMDIMGIKEEELIDGVDIAGVATYLAKTEEAGLNLFI
ncbi:MAG: CoA-disulfide reductase [Tissierellia bacterium]|nr:CoA-disulfide reductase [Tissierellia bacterium]